MSHLRDTDYTFMWMGKGYGVTREVSPG